MEQALWQMLSKKKHFRTNDTLYCNYICHVAWFLPLPYDSHKIQDLILYYNKDLPLQDNYMTQNFSDTYFSRDVCSKIGFIRQDIEERYEAKQINRKEKAILTASLLYAMDKIALTCGHYDAYRQGQEFFRPLVLELPEIEKMKKDNLCFCQDANTLVKKINADVVYIDPPYNSRHYCDSYHLLENVARWQKPKVYGKARKMKREGLKSQYCLQNAPKIFDDLVQNIKARYIIVSYNNMAKKGNARSNARILDSDLISSLEKRGKVKVFSQDHKSFCTGKSDIKGNKERLFVCECV